MNPDLGRFFHREDRTGPLFLYLFYNRDTWITLSFTFYLLFYLRSLDRSLDFDRSLNLNLNRYLYLNVRILMDSAAEGVKRFF